MSNVERVEEELASLPSAPPGLAGSALTMAAGLDDQRASLTMKALAARELRETMACIREIAPPARQEDFVDRIRDEVAEHRDRRAAPEAVQSS